MTIAAIWAIFKTIGSIVGILITFITFFSLISKKPLNALRRMIREESNSANDSLKNKLDEIEKRLDDSDQVDIISLRHSMTDIYHKYKNERQIPHYAKEDWLSMYDHYEKKGGNSYIHLITEEMKNWEEI